jgi:ribosomal protein S18 acetylase RimI-like enzyme
MSPAAVLALPRLDADHSSAADVAAHLARCSDAFVPPLAARVALADYADRLAARAAREEAWNGDVLVGLVAMYCNRPGETAFVSSVSVDAHWRGTGLGAALLAQAIARARRAGAPRIELEADSTNVPALSLYRRTGFLLLPADPVAAVLRLRLLLDRTDRP